MILDLVVIGILLLSALVAFWRGFVREVLTIISLLGAALATYMFGPKMVPVAQGWIVDPDAKDPQVLFGLIPYEMVGTALACLGSGYRGIRPGRRSHGRRVF